MDSQILAPYIAAASASFIVGRWAASKFRLESHPEPHPKEFSLEHARTGAMKLKFLACTILVVLELATSDIRNWKNIVLLASYVYATLLAFLPLVSRHPSSAIHSNAVLLVSLGSYAYRDLLPLATFTLVPKDLAQGWLLWAKILVLIMAGIVIPLSTPRSYTPVDLENPMAVPNAEQTCSLFSSLTYSYLDALIFLAYKQRSLSPDDLPVLADYDTAEYLTRKSFPVLDPHRKGASKHLLYGFLKVYRDEYITMPVLAMGTILFQFAGPAVLNRLLASLESTAEPFVRPWVWVALLFLVPFFRSFTQARYTWMATRQKVQAEGILVQLLFAHSLRIRMNTQTKDKDKRNLVGRINNLCTSDVSTVADVMELWIRVMLFPLQVTLAIWFLYLILGWSSFVGLAVILITLPLPSYLAKTLRKYQIVSRKKTDARVQQVTETMNVLRMIKWFAWENKIKEDIGVKREEELHAIKNVRLIVVLNDSINFVIPLLVMLATLSTYTLVMRLPLTASIVFTSLSVFDGILRQQIRDLMNQISVIIQGKVSLDRVDDFLRTTELLDLYSSQDLSVQTENDERIGFRDAQFSWSNQIDDSCYKLHIESEIIFQPGVINLIVGPTGVGKTAILLALLGEMHFVPVGPNPWINLPRQGGVAYASQQPWIENATIKQNIVFDTSIPFDEVRYKRVLYACALYPDLELLEARDETEVGERGLTLSGGQKARVSLARAIYSTAAIILLDDVLSSLDIHTAKWIVHNCLSTDLVQGRTVILVTHNIALTRPISQWVVSLGLDGSIVHGSVETVLKSSYLAAANLDEELEAVEDEVSATSDISESKGIGKLTVAEKSQQGMVKWSTYKVFLFNLSSQPVPFLCLICGLFLLNEATALFQSWFLGFWSDQYLEHPMSSVPVSFYLGVYSTSVVMAMLFYIVAYSLYAFATIRSAKIIHTKLIDSVVGTTLRWLDTTPMSRVITRITQDTSKIDNKFALMAVSFVGRTIFLLSKFTAIMILNPVFVLPGGIITLLSVFTGRIYMVAQLPIQRQMSAARSPMLAHFAAAISGLTSIRAYQAEKAFLWESTVRIDNFIRPAISFWNLNRWISMRSDILGGLFSAALGSYLVYGGGSRYGPANVGFSLSAALAFTSAILWWVRVGNELQLDANNLERVVEYLDIEQEQKPTQAGIPPAYWPASGEIRVENLTAKYSADGPEILHSLNFAIKSGERIAIVGRTGSGKSSLTLALLRSIPTEGKVYYDGISTDTVNLDSLRSNITIIPQVPELLGGSLRRNLDPSEAHDDLVLTDSLRAAGLFSLQTDRDEKSNLSLDSMISSEGSNLSLGERQIIAFARAIIRGSKLLILDEATSAIDYQTDVLIQSTLRNELRGVSVLTVAHRLRTIMDYDRIMVMEAGRIVELDTPINLLKDKAGYLRAMVDESSDRDELLAIAEGV
ncbi:multidrug resistance-associated ABC transporter [Mycena sanguinolenta]|nr:multidrug resistance-associated ABC transporter [Mycena sanguinolenta]